MNDNYSSFILKLLGFTALLFGLHYYILLQFFDGKLAIPLWLIYVFNAFTVFIVVAVIKHQLKNKDKNILNLFLLLTGIKMILILILLLPLFLKKSDHMVIEVCNFFIPYFLFLTFEIFSLNKFLQKS